MKCRKNSGEEEQLCITKVPIFNHLSREEMEEVAGLSTSRRYQKGEIIFTPDTLTSKLYIVNKGKVKVYRLSDNGREQMIRILEPGDFLGELMLFKNTSSHGYAEALSNTDLCIIRKHDFDRLLLQRPSISLKLLEELSVRLENAENLIEQLGSYDVESRTASMLLDLSEKQGSVSVVLPFSKGDLASLIGTSQETLSRKLSHLQERGLIKLEGQRKIIIQDPEGLQQLFV